MLTSLHSFSESANLHEVYYISDEHSLGIFPGLGPTEHFVELVDGCGEASFCRHVNVVFDLLSEVLELATKVNYYTRVEFQVGFFGFLEGSPEQEGVDVRCVVAQELARSFELLSFLLEFRVLLRSDFDLELLQGF